MENFNDREECFICSKQTKIMVTLQEVLVECEELTVAEVLKRLDFITISDAAHLCHTLCFMCIAKIQTCFEFKTLCFQIDQQLKAQIQSRLRAPSSILSVSLVEKHDEMPENGILIKEEDNLSDSADDCIVIDDDSCDPEPPNFVAEACPTAEYISNAYVETDAYNETFEPEENGFIEDREINNSMNVNNHEDSQRKEAKFQCPYCAKCFKYKGSLNTHMEMHTSSLEKPYSSSSGSGPNFRYNRNSPHYYKTPHTGDRKFVCTYCQKRFKWRHVYNQHLLIHTGQKPYTCQQCGKSFAWSSNYCTHKKIHAREKSLAYEAYNSSVESDVLNN